MLRLDLNLVFTIINLIVLYALMKKFLIGPVIAVMDERESLIKGQLADAAKDKETAAGIRKEWEVKREHFETQGSQIVAQAKEMAKNESARIISAANADAARILKDAKANAEAEKEKALMDARTQIAGLVVSAAAKVLDENAGEDQNRRLFEGYLAKAGVADESNRS